MKKKKDRTPSAIPLEKLFKTPDFERNFEILNEERRTADSRRTISALQGELIRNARAHVEYKERQAARASKSRGKGDDGRTMRELIEQLAKQHLNEPPRHVWPHLRTMIEGWADECEGDGTRYRYSTVQDKDKTITYKHFCELLAAARKEQQRGGPRRKTPD